MLDLWLRQFRVGDPIASLVEPKFTIFQDVVSEVPMLHLAIRAPDADGKRGVIDVMLSRPIHPGCTDYHLHRMMRGMLVEILMHEVDEAIYVNGVKTFDPHRSPPRTT